MKKIILLVLCLVPLFGFSQKIFGEIPIKSESVSKIQFIPVADSIFLRYTENYQGTIFNRALWISPTGRQLLSKYHWEYLDIAPSTNDTLYYYYLYGENSQTLKAFYLRDKMIKLNESVTLDGEVIGTFKNEFFNIILINRKFNKVEVLTLDGIQVVSKKNFDIPEDLAREIRNGSVFDFINGNSPINSFQGSSKYKLYKYGNFLYMTCDKFTDGSKSNGVKFFKIDITNGVTEYAKISITENDGFRSFLFGDNFYVYFISARRAKMNVYNLNGNELYSIRSTKDSTRDFSVYIRSVASRNVSKGLFSKLLSKSPWASSTLLSVFKSDSSVNILAGTFYNEKGVGVPIGLGTSALSAVIAASVSTMLQQAFREPPGIVTYYYYKQSTTSSEFSIDRKPVNIRQRMDDYEIAQLMKGKKARFNYKGYFPFKSGILAAYQMSHDSKISLVYFD